MYLKKSGFICLNVYINLPYLYSIDTVSYTHLTLPTIA